nr:MAG TPA: hypothetical protein [Caudoviricetes sp.]
MRYAVIEDGVVANVIILYSGGAKSFPDAVPCGDVPVAIGDTYDGQDFYREGARVLSPVEQARKDAEDMQAALELLGIDGETEVE